MSICKWVDMEDNKCQNLLKQDSPEELPSLLKYIESKTVSGFDDIEECGSLNQQLQSTARTTPTSDPVCALAKRQEDASQATNSERLHSVSISMPSSPLGNDLESNRKVLLMDNDEMDVSRKNPNFRDTPVDVSSKQPKQAKFHSQPIPVAVGIAYVDAVCSTGKASGPSEGQLRNSRIDEFKDKSFDSFKTWSGRLERQLSHLRGKQCDPEPEVNTTQNSEIEVLSVDRYFDALEGPELDTLKDSEGLVLPEDKQWPFLLRYPISAFGMCLGVSSQAILWKTLATSTSTSFLHINLSVNLVLWCISIGLTALILLIYSLKFILYFEAVRREYYHPIRVNFFFAPWIAFLFLALGAPPSLAKNLHAALWYILMSPIFCLELKIYGQWMSGGQRRLSKVANPSNHLAIVGNFVGALLGASMGLKEGPIFFFSVGLAHYIVLFVTLYQRLPTNETLPKELHPVFFLFVAAPSVASMAWANIQGSFDYGSRVAYFIALFLYVSLAVRANFFKGFRFSLAWWAYTFPMTGASIATIRYSSVVKNPVTQSLSVILSAISTLTVTALLITTILHAFVFRDLFPNDIAIAITTKRPKKSKKQFHLSSGNSDAKDIEASLKSAGSDGEGTEVSLRSISVDKK
ncbi:PREDICTED: S-type anion channel SLAH2-like isoform X2 [Nelumbo nucifera]|uniref:S-type anion channel SLAH2-like isoform X2 n=1 Tax=Nelumbo nucifera TaxID=4432 RepID=A0A1U7ZTD3_NELNU|nr:PREDICTED: S-type anion channel SLAH2-like isoform X2 [Nelumbo nucifera]